VIAGLLLLQLNYLWMSGRIARFRQGLKAPAAQVPGAHDG